MQSIKRTAKTLGLGALCLGAMAAFPLAAGAAEAPSVSVVEAIRIAIDANIVGYPLVTFDMARKQQSTGVPGSPSATTPSQRAQRGG